MRRVLAVIAGLVCMLPTLVAASNWKIDPDHSNVGFKVRHLMVSNVKGSFGKVAGTVNINDKDISKSSVNVIIETASIDTGVVKRDNHLKSADFLDVGKFPTMTFVSRQVVRQSGDKLKVTGDLTLHGVTREVVLDVGELSLEAKDPMGNLRRGASATTKINRKDYGLGWNKALETGGVAVGEEVVISLEVEMLKDVPK